MWEPQHLTILWASTACYRDSFTFTFTLYEATLNWLDKFSVHTPRNQNPTIIFRDDKCWQTAEYFLTTTGQFYEFCAKKRLPLFYSSEMDNIAVYSRCNAGYVSMARTLRSYVRISFGFSMFLRIFRDFVVLWRHYNEMITSPRGYARTKYLITKFRNLETGSPWASLVCRDKQ
jgi:hypothetical protein